MAYTGWMTLGTTEIINSSRALAYAKRAGIPVRCESACPNLHYALQDTDYLTSFDAPWIDAYTPASSEFLGFAGLQLTGISSGTSTRLVTDLPNEGAAVGALRRNRREIGVRVLAIAETEAGLNYGLAWLNSVLRGSLCSKNCVGDQLCFYDTCPDCCVNTPDEEHAAHIRTMHDVGVLQAPTITQMSAIGPGACDSGVPGPAWIAEVEYILVAGFPFIYHEPRLVFSPSSFTSKPSNPPTCLPPSDCSLDPSCTPSIPPSPPIPPSSCAVQTPANFDTAWGQILATDLSDWFEKSIYVVVTAGSTPMRSVVIRIFPDPNGIVFAIDGGNEQACSACLELRIPYVPANGTMVVDGRNERATLNCPAPGTQAVGSPLLYGAGFSPFTWPVLECGTGYAIQVQVDAANHGVGSTIDVYLADRWDSS